MPSLGMPWFMVALFFAKMLIRLMSFRINDYKIIGFFLGFVGIILGTRGGLVASWSRCSVGGCDVCLFRNDC